MAVVNVRLIGLHDSNGLVSVTSPDVNRWGFVHFSLFERAEIGTKAKVTEERGGQRRERKHLAANLTM